jgi:tetratricopeptide (TPR) repeat protein
MSKHASPLLILLVAALSYVNSFQGGFHYDDFHSIVDNPSIRTLSNLPDFFTAPSMFSGDTDKSMYRPLLLVSYAINFALGEYDVFGYHLINILLHASCALLCWVAFGLLFNDAQDQGRAAFAGLLFAAHPLAAEPVNYISGRSDLLSTFFYLGTLVLHLLWRQRTTTQDPLRGAALGLLSLFCFTLGLLTKSTVVTLPVILLLADWLMKTGTDERPHLSTWFRFHTGYWIVAGGYLVLLQSTDFLERSLANPAREMGTHLLTQIKAPAYYLKLAFMPVGLNVEHQFTESAAGAHVVWMAGLLMLSIGLICWIGRRRRSVSFLALWAAIVILPVSVMPLNVLVNERRLYLALAAFAWFAAFFLGRRMRRLSYVWLSLLCLTSLQRNEVWATELTLWQDAAQKAPRMYRVQTNLGKALQLDGDESGALAAYQRAIDIDPRHGDAYNNIGILHHRQGRTREAIDWYHRALERYPDYEEIYQNMADGFSDLGDLEQARVWYEKALMVDDKRGSIWANYGELLFELGDLDGADRAARKAIGLLPRQPEPYNNLGNVHSRRGEHEVALEMYGKAIDLGPESGIGDIYANMADTYLDMERGGEARTALERALQDDPENSRFHLALGRALRMLGDDASAELSFERAISLAPGVKRNHAVLADLHRANGDHGKAIAVYESALGIDSTYARALSGLARSLDATGQRTAAVRAYSRFLDVWGRQDANHRHARARLRELAQ